MCHKVIYYHCTECIIPSRIIILYHRKWVMVLPYIISSCFDVIDLLLPVPYTKVMILLLWDSSRTTTTTNIHSQSLALLPTDCLCCYCSRSGPNPNPDPDPVSSSSYHQHQHQHRHCHFHCRCQERERERERERGATTRSSYWFFALTEYLSGHDESKIIIISFSFFQDTKNRLSSIIRIE